MADHGIQTEMVGESFFYKGGGNRAFIESSKS